jgi:hypothetical protein
MGHAHGTFAGGCIDSSGHGWGLLSWAYRIFASLLEPYSLRHAAAVGLLMQVSVCVCVCVCVCLQPAPCRGGVFCRGSVFCLCLSLSLQCRHRPACTASGHPPSVRLQTRLSTAQTQTRAHTHTHTHTKTDCKIDHTRAHTDTHTHTHTHTHNPPQMPFSYVFVYNAADLTVPQRTLYSLLDVS